MTVAAGNPTTHQLPAQQRAARASRQPADAALHHLELGAAHGRGMAAVRGALRHPDRAGLRPERDRLDRGDPRRERGASARSGGRSPITTSRSSMPTARRLPAGEIGQVEIGGFADHAYRYLADDGSVHGQRPRPHPHRRPRPARRRRLPAPHRPREGPDHPRRRQHLAGRDRQLPDAAPGGDRGRDRRRAGRGLRRGGGELRGGAAGRRDRRRRRCCAIAATGCRPSRRRSRSCSARRCPRPSAASSTARCWWSGGVPEPCEQPAGTLRLTRCGGFNAGQASGPMTGTGCAGHAQSRGQKHRERRRRRRTLRAPSGAVAHELQAPRTPDRPRPAVILVVATARRPTGQRPAQGPYVEAADHSSCERVAAPAASSTSVMVDARASRRPSSSDKQMAYASHGGKDEA